MDDPLRSPSETAHLVALAGLPGMGPTRLNALLGAVSPSEGWQLVSTGRLVDRPEIFAGVRGRHRELCSGWHRAAREVDVSRTWHQHRSAGIDVAALGSSSYPRRLVDDPDPPAVVFVRGDLDSLDRATVGIVGTRRCTRYGHDVARELGRELASRGVTVVSGLAAGIDAAAHAGVLDVDGAPPVAVVGTGLDVVYPRANRSLWDAVARRGAVLTEAPLGTPPEAWRFPARNRVIAGLSDAVIVVESHAAGGSLYTVDEAVGRDRPVFAVPGPIRSPASEGTNRLLADGAVPLCSVVDVLDALDRHDEGEPSPPAGGTVSGPDELSDAERSVIDAAGWSPASIDELASSTGLEFGELSLAVERLTAAGILDRRGGWLERTSQ